MLPETETLATPVAPKVTTVFVKVKREVDLGYPGFIKVARSFIHKKQQIPFGLRDASRTSFEISLTAEINDGDLDTVIAELTGRANAIADRELRVQNPEVFQKAQEQGEPEEAFVVGSTVVSSTPATDSEDY